MSVSITHAKVSGKSSGSDPDRVYGTHWDADHVVPVATTAEAQAASSDTVLMTPAKTLDLVNANVPSGSALTKTDDTNVTLTLGGTPTTALLRATSITVGWTGTLAAARLNANVVQSVVNDTNVTGSIATQALTIGWTGTLSPARGGTGVANNAASTITISGNFGTTFTVTGATAVTLPTTGTLATLAGTEELDNKTLDSSVGKGTWTASGTWTLPAVTLGGAITYGGVTLSNSVTGTGSMVLATSPTLTTAALGSSTATTHSARDNSTKLATTAYVDTATRERLSANRTYYVRTDGSNSNNGLTNSSGGAFLTIQKAWDTLITLDLNGYAVTIQIGDGTYTAGLAASAPPVGGNVTINGNSSTPANVVISRTSGHCIAISTVASVNVQNLEMRTTTSGACVIATVAGANVRLNAGIRFGACAGAHVAVQAGGSVYISTLYAIVGAASFHYYIENNGILSLNSSLAITNSGTNAFTYFAVALNGAIINTAGNTYTGGTITGTRYLASTNGVIQTYGGGASYFPGDVAGSTSSGGQYA